MTDQDQRADRNDERVEDLEVRGDEAREVAGGKKANPSKRSKGQGVRYGKTDAGRYGGKKES